MHRALNGLNTFTIYACRFVTLVDLYWVFFVYYRHVENDIGIIINPPIDINKTSKTYYQPNKTEKKSRKIYRHCEFFLFVCLFCFVVGIGLSWDSFRLN